MEINSPEAMMGAIKLLIMQMNRPQRKKFHKWIKDKINTYNFNYPEGYVIKEKQDEADKQSSADAILTVPDTRLIDSQGAPLPSTEPTV